MPDGLTLVVSPLVALMADQVRSLVARGISATYLSATLDADERRRREEGLSAGDYKLVFVARADKALYAAKNAGRNTVRVAE